MGFISTSLTAAEILSSQNTSIASTQTVNEQQGVVLDTIDKFFADIVERDDQILEIVDQIKAKQNQILSICASAVGIGCSLLEDVSTLYADHSIISGVSTEIAGYIGTTVGVGTIKLDELQAYTYPNLETINVSSNNPIANPSEVNLSSSTSGTGADSNFETNVGSSLSPIYGIDSTNHPVGQDTACNNYRTQIDTILGEIEVLRASSSISTLESEATTLKEYRKGLQLEAWSLGKASAKLVSKKSTNDSIVGILS
jgi:hypothetical protein